MPRPDGAYNLVAERDNEQEDTVVAQPKTGAEGNGDGNRWEYTDGAALVVFPSTQKVTAPAHAETVGACFGLVHVVG